MNDNRERLRARVRRLVDVLGADLTERLTLVGGTVPALADGAVPVRMTEDIDVVVRGGLRDWRSCIDDMESRGFRTSREEDAPICRFEHGDLVVDVMETAGDLGFTNRWYAKACDARVTTSIDGLHAISPLYFVATKFDAFLSRGRHDPLVSHDLEDMIVVLRRDEGLFAEISTGTDNVHVALREQMVQLMADPFAADYVRAQVESDDVSQQQAEVLIQRIIAAGQGQVLPPRRPRSTNWNGGGGWGGGWNSG